MSLAQLSTEPGSKEPVMKAVITHKPNKKDPSKAFKLETVPIPEPQPGEYLVRMHLVPVHPADRFTLIGMFPGSPEPDYWPITPGTDGMGVIAKSGTGALKFGVGDRVAVAGFPLERGNGTWSNYIVLREDEIVNIPDKMSEVEAAQFWTNPASAWYMLRMIEAPKGEFVIFSGANSTLGRMCMYLAQHMELKPIGIVQTDKEKEKLMKHNFTFIISLESEEILPRVQSITDNKGAWAALDSVGGLVTGHLTSAIRRGGVVVIYGMMGDDVAHIPISPIMINHVRIEGFWLNGVINAMDFDEKRRMCEDILELASKHAILFGEVQKTFSIRDAAQAVSESTHATDGKKVFIKTS